MVVIHVLYKEIYYLLKLRLVAKMVRLHTLNILILKLGLHRLSLSFSTQQKI